MKRFIPISLVILAGVVLLASCRKRDYYDEPNNDRDYWYAQERGTVEWSSDVCQYFVVDLRDTYAIMRSLTSAEDYPYPDDYLYGNYNNIGTREYFNDAGSDNFNDGYVMRATIVEFEPNRDIAIDKAKLDYCGGIVTKSMKVRQRPNSIRLSK